MTNISEAVQRLVKRIYATPVKANNGKVFPRSGLQGAPMVHRVRTDWNNNGASTYIGDCVQSGVSTMVLDDVTAGIFLQIINHKEQIGGDIEMITSDTEVANSKLFNKTVQMQDCDDKETIGKHMTKNTRQIVVGNNAFSITLPVLNGICDRKPIKIRLVTVSNVMTSIFDSKDSEHQKYSDLFQRLKNECGLKAIYYMPSEFFTQYNPNNVLDVKKAQISTVLIHTEDNYDGPISVYDIKGNQIYLADRKVAKFLPRHSLSYKAGHLDVQHNDITCGPGVLCIHKKDYQNAVKSGQFLNYLGNRIQNKIRPNEYGIQVPEMNKGTPGKNTYWHDFGVGFSLTDTKPLDPNQTPEYMHNYTFFGSGAVGKLKRDSALSLCNSRNFQLIFQGAQISKNASSIVLKHFLERFPLDRIWDDISIEDYVNANAK